MDLDGRARGLRDFSAEPSVERSLPLAVRRIDAEHQGGGSRCRAGAVRLFLSADAAGASLDCAHLDHRSDRSLLFPATEDLQGARLELPGLLHRVLHSAWQEL